MEDFSQIVERGAIVAYEAFSALSDEELKNWRDLKNDKSKDIWRSVSFHLLTWYDKILAGS
jgi:hypothetical protein